MNHWNWTRFIKLKATLFVFGVIMGSIVTLIYLKIDFSKLLDLQDIETITAWAPVIAASSTVILAIITGVYVFITRSMLNEQRKIMKRDRLAKEMDLVVASLFAKIDNPHIFMRGTPGNRDGVSSHVKEYHRLWDRITENKYLCIEFLRSAIDDFQKNKTNTVGDNETDSSFEKAKNDLFDMIKTRYEEIIEELKRLE